MNQELLKVKLKLGAVCLLLSLGMIVILCGESFFSYQKNKETLLAEARQTISQKINELEKMIDSDLMRINALNSFSLNKKNLEVVYENSPFNFLLKYCPSARSFYIFILFGPEGQMYSKYGPLKEKLIPRDIISNVYQDFTKFKIFYDKDKIYFSKGGLYQEQTPSIILLMQGIKDFVKYVEEEDIGLEIIDKTESFESNKEGIWNHITLTYSRTWWNFFYHHRLVLLLGSVLSVAIGFFVFLKGAGGIVKFVENAHQNEREKLESSRALAWQNLKTVEGEKETLKKQKLALEESREGRHKIIKNIYPSYEKMWGGLQEIQKNLIVRGTVEKIDEVVPKFVRSIRDLDIKNKRETLSLRAVIKEIEQAFSEDITKNNINIFIKGDDFLISGPLSNLYYVFYFILKKSISRLPLDGKIEIDLESTSLWAKVTIQDNGFLLSEDQRNHLSEIDVYKSESFLDEPTEKELSKAAKILGWQLFWGKKKQNLNVTEVVIRYGPEKPLKKESMSNIISLFKKQ